jgi:enterochelin esterase family protein
MKKLISFFAVFFCCANTLIAQMLPEGTPAETNVPASQYPAVDNNSRATFKIKAPDAQQYRIDAGHRHPAGSRQRQGLLPPFV